MSSSPDSRPDNLPTLNVGGHPDVKLHKTTVWQNRKAIFICTIIGSASFQYGMDFMMIGSFQAEPGFLKIFGYKDPATVTGYNISTKVQQLISSLMVLGAFVGSLLAGPLSQKLNRRQVLGIAVVICMISLGIQLGTTVLGGVYFARLFIGVGNGLFMTVTQLYIQECSPPHLRGMMFTFFQFFVSFGSLVAALIANRVALMDSKLCYQIPLAVLYIVPTFLAIALPFVPDTPRWYVSKGRDEEGLVALRRLRGSSTPEHLVLAEFAEIRAGHAAEMAIKSQSNFMAIFDREDGSLRRTIVSVSAVGLQGASGAMFLLSYGAYFFEMAGMYGHSTFVDGIIIAVIGLAGVMTTSFFIRVMTRRALLMGAIVVQGISMLLMAVVYTVDPDSIPARKSLIFFLSVYCFWYGGWTGPTAWVVGGEIPSQKLRSHTLGLSAAIGFLLGWLASFTAPYFINAEDLNWGPKYGYIWFGSNALALVWTFFMIPETKDRTLEEIDEMFAQRVPARKFSSYRCVGAQQAREEAVVGEVKDEKASFEHLDSPSLSEASLKH